jgi:hypothetical protein
VYRALTGQGERRDTSRKEILIRERELNWREMIIVDLKLLEFGTNPSLNSKFIENSVFCHSRASLSHDASTQILMTQVVFQTH